MEFKIEKAALLQGLYLAQGISIARARCRSWRTSSRTDGKDKLLVAATDLNVTSPPSCRARWRRRAASPSAPSTCTTSSSRCRASRLSLKPHREPVRRHQGAARSSTRSSAWPTATFPKLPNHREVKFSQGRRGDPARHDRQDLLLHLDRRDALPLERRALRVRRQASARMVSTDGHRLSKIERPLAGGPKLAQGIIIPRKGLHGDPARARDRRGAGRARHPQTGTSSCASETWRSRSS